MCVYLPGMRVLSYQEAIQRLLDVEDEHIMTCSLMLINLLRPLVRGTENRVNDGSLRW